MLSMDTEQATETPSTFKRDAVGLLTKEHRKAQRLFSQFDSVKDSGSPSKIFEIARQVCGDLLIHMAIEEAIFYPMVRQHIDDDILMDAAETEHESTKELIRQIGEIDPADAMFAAKVTVLSEQMDLHIQEEESVMFPKALVSGIDLVALGEELQQAKNDMRVDLGLQPEDWYKIKTRAAQNRQLARRKVASAAASRNIAPAQLRLTINTPRAESSLTARGPATA